MGVNPKVNSDTIFIVATCLENGETLFNACIKAGFTREALRQRMKIDPLAKDLLKNARERYKDNIARLKAANEKAMRSKRWAAREKKRLYTIKWRERNNANKNPTAL